MARKIEYLDSENNTPWWKRLQDFRVSLDYGFAFEQPLTELPIYFSMWNDLGKEAWSLMKSKDLRNEVSLMPCLDHTKLNGYKEYSLAHVMLSTIAHGYVWQEGQKDIPKVLPRCLAVPWHHVSEYLGLKPVYCCQDVLTNWQYDTENGELDLICPVPGGSATQSYHHVALQVELDHACAFKHFINAFESAEAQDNDGLVAALENIEETIYKMKDTLSKLHEMLHPSDFFTCLRPFYEGWGSHSSLLPKGLIYEGVKKTPLHFEGCNASHSPILQTLDAVLGIKHKKDVAGHQMRTRDYMTSCQRNLLNTIGRGPSLRKYVRKSKSVNLVLAYNQCVIALADLRSYHLRIAMRFFTKPSDDDSDSQDTNKITQGKGAKATMKNLRGIRDGTVTNLLNM